jgi:hypothetical protein
MNVTMSVPRLKSWLLLASLLVTVSAARLGQAEIQSVGDIQVCYNCSFGEHPVLDGPTFYIHNTSGSSITNGVLKIGPGGGLTDSFIVGTIAAGGTAQVAPGISNDGRPGHTFFAFTGSIRDTSDVGPDGNDTQFEFTGFQGSNVVDSGVFTPAATQGPSLDESVSSINFLGGPDGNDGPCNNCFDKTVASLTITSSFSKTSTMPLQQGVTTFDYAAGPNLTHTLDYTGTDVPSGITVRSTISWITDSGWGNQFDSLTARTAFFGKKCLHEQISVGGNLVFACLVTLDQCSPVGQPNGPFSGANCPLPAANQFIGLALEFENEQSNPSLVNGPGLIEGTDNAQTCTPRPGCEQLTNVFTSIGGPGPIIINGKGGHLSIFVPFSTP